MNRIIILLLIFQVTNWIDCSRKKQRHGFERKETALLIVTQNNASRTNFLHGKINNKRQNGKFRLFGKWDKAIYYIKSECSRIDEKNNKTRYDCVGKAIHRNVDYATKWYTHRLESELENQTHKIIWDFKTQIDYLIPVRRPDVGLINRKNKETTCI